MRAAGSFAAMTGRVALTLALASGCAVALEDSDGAGDSFVVGGKADALTGTDSGAVLALANSASYELLDEDVGLDRRAAENMTAHRAGEDAALGTADDNAFDTLAELDSVSWVGPRAFEKLRAFATANGFGLAEAKPCLIISEYIEGSGQYNKAVELFNCGSVALDLADFSLCMVRNGATDCSLTGDLGAEFLAAGEVVTVCRRAEFHPASLDPIPALAQVCDLERPGLMTFNGDDRLVVLGEDGSTVDALGRLGYRPPVSTWRDVVLSRCNFEAADGVSYYEHSDYFREHSRSDVSGFGLAPISGCN